LSVVYQRMSLKLLSPDARDLIPTGALLQQPSTELTALHRPTDWIRGKGWDEGVKEREKRGRDIRKGNGKWETWKREKERREDWQKRRKK